MTNRRVLTEEEKAEVRGRFDHTCYICGKALEGYEETEIEYDHIYAFGDGYSKT